MIKIIAKLTEAGIQTTGIYSRLPEMIESAIETVKIMGFEYWVNNTTSGIKIRNIVKELA